MSFINFITLLVAVFYYKGLTMKLISNNVLSVLLLQSRTTTCITIIIIINVLLLLLLQSLVLFLLLLTLLSTSSLSPPSSCQGWSWDAQAWQRLSPWGPASGRVPMAGSWRKLPGRHSGRRCSPTTSAKDVTPSDMCQSGRGDEHTQSPAQFDCVRNDMNKVECVW